MATKDSREGEYQIETVTGSITKYRVFKGGKWQKWKQIQGTTLDAERAAGREGAKTRFR